MLNKTAVIFLLLVLFSADSYGNEWFSMHKGLNDAVYALESYNGNIAAGGKFTNSFGNKLNRVGLWNGHQWAPLGEGFNNNVLCLEVYNGNLIAGGIFNSSGGTPLNRIARWNGSAWLPLGAGIIGEVNCLTIFEGNLIAAGDFSTVGGNAISNIAKWNGTTWTGLGLGLEDEVYSLTVHNGKLYAGGDFSGKVAVWSGSSWNTVAGGLGDDVRALASYNGSLYAGGDFSEHILMLNGNSWDKVGEGLDDDVLALTVHDGNLVAGGRFREAELTDSGIEVNRIAKWNGTQWSSISSGMSDEVYAVHSTGDGLRLAAGGKFKKAGGVNVRNISYSEKTGVVEGVVRYPGGTLLRRGVVKALRLDQITRKVIISDSCRIQLNGTYKLLKVPNTPHIIITFPEDELDNFIPTYYPSTVHWHLSPFVTPGAVTQNINITVLPRAGGIGPGKIRGKVKLNFIPVFSESDGSAEDTLDYRGDAIVYAKKGNEFFGYSITNSTERYELAGLTEGGYQVIVSRVGYEPDARDIMLNFSGGFVVDSVDFLLDPKEIVVSITNNNTAPPDYRLHQNYPNPFNPVTNIRYDIRSASYVKLSIHDILGRQVSELVNARQEAGAYTVSWNAGSLNSGIYFYTIEVTEKSLSPGQNSSYIETRKMILIK